METSSLWNANSGLQNVLRVWKEVLLAFCKTKKKQNPHDTFIRMKPNDTNGCASFCALQNALFSNWM